MLVIAAANRASPETAQSDDMPTNLSSGDIADINTISTFLAHNAQIPCSSCNNTIYILAGNAILPTAQALFHHLAIQPRSNPVTLVITGGIGHSTHYLYDAVRQEYSEHFSEVKLDGMPEARVLEHLLQQQYPELYERLQESPSNLMIEGQSTNCGSNAVESVRVLSAHNIKSGSLVIVQDPTMMRRTLACFEKAYQDEQTASKSTPPTLDAWATFIPLLQLGNGQAVWNLEGCSSGPSSIRPEQLWNLDRFIDLIMGEVPRMRDDECGYGPRGKGFITRVNIPAEVEDAWGRLKGVVEHRR